MCIPLLHQSRGDKIVVIILKFLWSALLHQFFRFVAMMYNKNYINLAHDTLIIPQSLKASKPRIR